MQAAILPKACGGSGVAWPGFQRPGFANDTITAFGFNRIALCEKST
jgi:hypothetical protein